MSLLLLLSVTLCLGLALTVSWLRRSELRALRVGLRDRAEAKKRGSDRARLQYPHVDLSRCIGCGSCVRACPEEGVLEVIHGQALVVHGARCVGHGRCAEECPVGAIALTLGDLKDRRDLPALDEGLQAIGVPGVYLAGELTGHALVRTAIEHGKAVVAEVARRARQEGPPPDEQLDLCIVGCGPAGLAASLEAKKQGLRFQTLEQDTLGGTVSKYPRQKMVMTRPVELPLYGRLKHSSYRKEELIEIWERIVREHALPIRYGFEFQGLEPLPEGGYLVRGNRGASVRARRVCLALGRRGTPRQLGVPGEELPKVAYSLLDTQSHQNRNVLVVGGGDSAVEAALGLAEQPGNRVHLSYRKNAFFRIKARNEARLMAAVQEEKLELILNSRVKEILPDRVALIVDEDSTQRILELPNDEVFVFAGGIPPYRLLEGCGISFDPADRPDQASLADRGTGLMPALGVAFVLAWMALFWALRYSAYYSLGADCRPTHALHDFLRPGSGIGLVFGIGAATMVACNLAYLLRKASWFPLRFASLQGWMTSHIATGVFALLLAVLHGAFDPKQTVGGHALAGMAFLVTTGAIGRYFYSFVPRAANGRELALEEVRDQLRAQEAGWDLAEGSAVDRVRREIQELIENGRWSGGFFRRLLALLASQRQWRRTLRRLRAEGAAQQLAPEQLHQLLRLARRAQRTALMSAHYEDLRGILASWRYFHRWVAVLMVLLIGVHVATALRYGGVLLPGSFPR